MTGSSENTFYIERGDLPEGSTTLIQESLTIGGVKNCNIWLNAQEISELHAIIERDEGHFYLSVVGAAGKTTLFGLLIDVNKRVRLVDRDEFQIGPYSLTISELSDDALKIRVVLGGSGTAGSSLKEGELLDLHDRISVADVGVLKQSWNERNKGKAGGPSALRPRALPQHLKASYHWKPNRDLVRPWSLAICTWALILVGALSGWAVFNYKEAFAPGRISVAHASTTFTKKPAIAGQHSGKDCDSCHVSGVSETNREMMNAKCNGCHQAEGFAATIIPAHRAAGIMCTTCHSEHRGRGFRPMQAALESCVKCHDNNSNYRYNGRTLPTPHGGTYGYPAANGLWNWKGLDREELEAKPEISTQITNSRTTVSEAQRQLSALFHAIHNERLRVVPGIAGIEDADSGNKVLSCSSCHNPPYGGAKVDRDKPRTTCAHCHNTQTFENSSNSKAIETPSCTSCHVQHIKDAHWASALRVAEVKASSEAARQP